MFLTKVIRKQLQTFKCTNIVVNIFNLKVTVISCNCYSSASKPSEQCSLTTEKVNENIGLVKKFSSPQPNLNTQYLCNPSNLEEINYNIIHRKGVGDIKKTVECYKVLQSLQESSQEYKDAHQMFVNEALKIPNQSHPDILKYGETPFVLKTLGTKKEFTFKPKKFNDIVKPLNVVRNENISNFTGQRGYFFMGQVAELESALVQWSIEKLLSSGFELISVPDILYRNVIESCGMDTKGERNQVFTLNEDDYGNDLCLSGTAEMAIAQYLMNQDIPEEKLPLRLAAVSRCYRAETSKVSEERGIFRVHNFTKVEMFAVTKPGDSSQVLEEFRDIEEKQFTSLGLHLQILDMPLHELGAQAYRKFDIEAWMPGKQMWGEVSSCSDCTDYQSRRLSIKSGDQFLHTVNGTACAVPRLIIAILETHQRSNGTVDIPEVLQPFMRGKTCIDHISNADVPYCKFLKSKPLTKL